MHHKLSPERSNITISVRKMCRYMILSEISLGESYMESFLMQGSLGTAPDAVSLRCLAMASEAPANAQGQAEI